MNRESMLWMAVVFLAGLMALNLVRNFNARKISVSGATLSQKLIIYRLVLFKCANDFFLATMLTFISATDNQDWNQMTDASKIRIAILCLASGLKVVDALLDNTLNRVQSGKSPISTGDSNPQAFTKP